MRHRMTIAALVASGLIATGCGRSGDDPVVSRAVDGTIVDLRGGMWSMAAAGGSDSGVVVEGAVDDRGTLRPAISIVDESGAIGSTSVLPVDGPLLGIDVAFDGEAAVVVGVLCHRWTELDDPPSLHDTPEQTAEAACGSSDVVVGVWRVADETWSEISVLGGFSAARGVLAVGGGRAVLAGLGSDEAGGGRDAAATIVVAATGTPEAEIEGTVEPPVEWSGDLDRRTTYCVLADEVVALVAWRGEEPPEGLVGDGSTVTAPGTDRRFAAFVLDGAEWTPSAIEGEVIPSEQEVCTPSGIVGLTNTGASVALSLDGERLESRPVAGLAEVPGVTGLEVAGGGNAYAFGSRPTPDDVSPDAPVDTEVFAIDDGTWASRGEAPLGSGSSVFFVGEQPFVRQIGQRGDTPEAYFEMPG